MKLPTMAMAVVHMTSVLGMTFGMEHLGPLEVAVMMLTGRPLEVEVVDPKEKNPRVKKPMIIRLTSCLCLMSQSPQLRFDLITC